MIKRIVPLLLLLFSISGFSQYAVLDGYISEGMNSNLALEQKEIAYQKAAAALSEARGKFLPAISIDARYSRAGGGRSIEFPVGDIVNPIYATLNQLTQSNQFPVDLPNESIPFLREEEHETKIRVVQPIFQPQIWANAKLKKQLRKSAKEARTAYAQQLKAEITQAYFTYLKTRQVKVLLAETENLLAENLRVSQKLFAAEQATEDVVFRAEVEQSQLQERQAEAERDFQVSKAYFNFLLNRDFTTEIAPIDDADLVFHTIPEMANLQNSAQGNRAELKQLSAAISAADQHIKLNQAAFLPSISAVLDYGFQGEKYNFNKDEDYWMASGILQWNLFNGFQDRAKIQQAKLQKQLLSKQQEEVRMQINLEITKAYHTFEVAQKRLTVAQKRVISAEKSFHIISKKYEQGITSQLSFIDARTALTNAQISLVLAKYDYQIEHSAVVFKAGLSEKAEGF